ncbi:hypothetical protein B6N60_03212 [Richelia sinica FACHB-800]|uniref:Uncharacterized protein n=1 Tax=Richelia sinica FACHB-800 TaxID=1357546 RepID=A0A975Y5R9_9NOST|nr:hypothetical protein [Richelia sinica]MBD2663335.1 hypothetical protein [Richelia sinica FACHB-800]QXE24507.1 hypothetical protein B6N60_03212 [Richelia sinica FACHB-800]
MHHWIGSESDKTLEQTPSAKMPGGSLDSYHNPHSCYHEEQQIYQHLLHLVQKESPDHMIERCRALFVDGADYPEHEVLLILDKITASKQAANEFQFFLNRCCHILINRWHMQPQLHYAIADLIELFETPSTRSRVTSFRAREIRRLRELVKHFTQSEQYLILRRFIQVIDQHPTWGNRQHQPLMNLIPRYPYLYEHCLISEDSTFEQQQTVKHFQARVQKKFEIDLSQYITYKLRRVQVLRKYSPEEANRILRPVNNPTLLTDSELYSTLKQFLGKPEQGCTYNELAQKFIQYSSQARTFHEYKDDLYEYLITSIDHQYGKRQFNQKLYTHLQNTLPQADFQKPDEFLVVRTCSQLLNFLVVNSPAAPQHFTFLDLISNQGTLPTIGLLLKIVLISRKVKPFLEKKVAILFNHYESATTDCIGWLVGTLEQLNIALSIHFGNVDLSFFKRFC